MGGLDGRAAAAWVRLIARRPTAIIYRVQTMITGRAPLANPPAVRTPTVNGLTLAGAVTLNIIDSACAGFLAIGDALRIAGDAQLYTITAQISSVVGSNAFVGVAITPALVRNAASGAAITFTFAADHGPLNAALGQYRVSEIDGQLVQQSDIPIFVPARSLGAVVPKNLDFVLVGILPAQQQVRQVINFRGAVVSNPVGYILQTR